MKSKFTKILGVLLVALFAACVFAPALLVPLGVCAVAVAGVGLLAAKGYVYLARHGHPTAINTLPANVGSSHCSRRYKSAAAIATRYLFAKKGADDEHVAVVAATADQPIGVITDEAAAAEDPINVELLGVTDRTLPCVAAGAIAVGVDVFATAAGKVDVAPTAAGTYWKVGTALTAAGAADDPIEVATCRPEKLVVRAALTQTAAGTIAALNSTAVNPTKADFDALLAEAGKLQADFYALSASLNGGAGTKVATS